MINSNDTTVSTVSATATDSEIATSSEYQGAEVTTMTTSTETKATKKAPKAKVSYPFETKAQIAAKIAASDEYTVAALCQLHPWQTAHEQETKTTEIKNRRGFMSSHAVNGSKLAEKTKSGEGFTVEEMDKARSIVCRYTRQLAVASREDALAADPSLAATAAIFGV